MDKPKWKKYEELVYEIQKDLASDAEVKPDDHILGQDSKTERQIDISIKRSVGQFSVLIIIDCKAYTSPVDVKDVGEFISLVKDVRANKGAIVSSAGFTPAAIEMAKTHGIDTLRHVDTSNIDWKTYVTIPVLLERTFLKGYQFSFTNFQTLPIEIGQIDPAYLEISDSNDAHLGFIRDIIANKWNNEEIPQTPGEVNLTIGQGVFINTTRGKFKTDIAATLTVAKEYYFGGLPIEAKGFYNEQTGTITTRQLITDKLEPYLIETGQVEGWQKIEDPTKLAVQPVIGTGYSDHMSLLKDSQAQNQPPEKEVTTTK